MRPAIKGSTLELGAIVQRDPLRESSRDPETFQHSHHAICSETDVHFDRGTLSRTGVDDRKSPERSAVTERVAHEVHRPRFVRICRQWESDSRHSYFLFPLTPDCKPFQTIKTSYPLMIVRDSLPTESPSQHRASPARILPGQLAKTLPQMQLIRTFDHRVSHRAAVKAQ